MKLAGVAADREHALVQLARVSSNVPTVADSAIAVEAADDDGLLTLTARDVSAGREPLRQWFPDRPVMGTVRLRYEAVPPGTDAPRGAAPPIELRAEAGAVSGGGATTLLRPPVSRAFLAIEWDLSMLHAGMSAVQSPLWGPGEAVSPDQLDEVYFMAGDLHRFPAAPPEAGFFSAWQGEPPFDAADLMHWTEKTYGHFEQFFGTRPAPYAVFMRRNPVNAGGGMGMHRSFIVTFGEAAGSDPESLRSRSHTRCSTRSSR